MELKMPSINDWTGRDSDIELHLSSNTCRGTGHKIPRSGCLEIFDCSSH